MNPVKFVRSLLTGLTLFLVVSQTRAEYRTVLVQVKQEKDKKVLVTIYSDEKTERKSAASVDEAVKVIREMQGWGSAVGVYVTSEQGIAPADLKGLLNTVLDNSWLDLEYFGRKVPKIVGDHFLPPLRVPAEKDIENVTADAVRPNTHFKDFKVEKADLLMILRKYHVIPEEDWRHNYHHVGLEDRTGTIRLRDGTIIQYMVRPGGLASLTFSDGRKLFLIQEVHKRK